MHTLGPGTSGEMALPPFRGNDGDKGAAVHFGSMVVRLIDAEKKMLQYGSSGTERSYHARSLRSSKMRSHAHPKHVSEMGGWFWTPMLRALCSRRRLERGRLGSRSITKSEGGFSFGHVRV
jgi:hypothetical protein